MAEPPEDDGPPPTPDWIVTFTDLMSLLLTFFILLLTFSTPRVEKLFELQGDIFGSYGMIKDSRNDLDTDLEALPILQGRDQRFPHAPATPPRFQPLEDHVPNLELKRLKDRSGEEIDFDRIEEGYRITIGEAVRFEPGEPGMTGESYPRLAKIAKALNHYSYHIMVVGYVGRDEQRLIRAKGDDLMDLAVRRAVGVATRMVERHGIDRKIIGVAGYGPQAGDDRPGRVEIILADKARFGGR